MSSIKLKGSSSGDVTITVPAVAGTNTVTIPAATGNLPLSNLDHVTNRRNANPIIINGNMAVAQRGTSHASLTGVAYTLDRFETSAFNVGDGVYRVDQSTNVPSGQGFTNSMKVYCTTADTSQDTNNQLYLQTQLEGTATSFLKYFVASPDTITLAFWVRSNRTGTHSLAVKLSDNGTAENSGDTRIYHKLYTISSANTWEKQICTITLDSSTNETQVTGTGFAVAVQFWLGAGTNRDGASADSWQDNGNATIASANQDLLGSTSNDWFITGLQMEVGSFDSTTIPPFQHESYGDSLQRCQRYFQIFTQPPLIGSANANNTIARASIGLFPVQMRAAPTAVQSGTLSWFYSNSHQPTSTAFSASYTDVDGAEFDITVSGTGMTATHPCSVFQSGSAFISFSAEL